MGQAVADLPDPLDSQAPAVGLSADDLLSKLAGDEIDRMLAEADEGGTDLSAEPVPVQSAPATSAADKTVFESTDSHEAEPTGSVSGDPHPSQEASPAPHEPFPAELAASDVDLDAVLNTADAERAALSEHPAIPESVPTPIDLGDSAEKRRRLPLFLKPLVWINAPLDPWPDQLREILGKIGIMTMINAAAVIAYVVLFRRHHH
jgi:hypothetical protein